MVKYRKFQHFDVQCVRCLSWQVQDSGIYDHLLAVIAAARDPEAEAERMQARSIALSSIVILEKMDVSALALISQFSGNVIEDDATVAEIHNTSSRIEGERK